MNKVLHWEGGDIPLASQGGQFHTMDQKGLATLHIVEQQKVGINIEKGKLEIRIDTKIHSVERLLVVTMDTKPLQNHV